MSGVTHLFKVLYDFRLINRHESVMRLRYLALLITLTLTTSASFGGDNAIIPKGTKFYHWGPTAQEEWARAGFPEDAALKHRMRLQKGYYISLDALDSASYGPSLIVFESKTDLQMEKDIHKLSGSTGEWYSTQDPIGLFQPHLGSIDDIYSSKKFRSGKMNLYDFMRVSASFSLVDSPELKEIYPIVHKIIVDQPFTAQEKGKFVEDLIDAGIWYRSITSRFGPSPFGEKTLTKYRGEMIAHLADIGLPSRFHDHPNYKAIWDQYLEILGISPDEISSYKTAQAAHQLNSECLSNAIRKEILDLR
jgi:hypothetical protein